MTTLREDIPEDDVKVVEVPWRMFLAYMATEWKPGQHLAIIGPTGEGKTTLAIPLLQLRKWVMVLDPKGMDATLEKSGFVRVTEFPNGHLPRKLANQVAEGKPLRILIGGASDSEAADKHLRELMRQAIEMVRVQGGWSLYADEFQILADARMFNLGKPVEKHLISARMRKTSVVTSFQAPAWVPRAATRQTSFMVLMPTRDIDMIKAVAQAMGRPWQEVARAVQELPPYHDLVIPKSPRAPMMLIHPPNLS